ncbi:MAG: assimilatory sulfite reductase (NADPH) flavoprotein subunit [Pseudomonadota bacterium]
MATASHDIAPLIEADTLQQLDAAVGHLSATQLIWASGYLAGRAAQAQPLAYPLAQPVAQALAQPAAPVAAPASYGQAAPEEWAILYATETGNSRRLATRLAERARENGMAVRLEDLATYKPRQFAKESHVLFVVATHGLGDAPDGTAGFFDFLSGERAPRLDNLAYSVLSLGDSSYDDFCLVGQELDARLEALGATRLADRVDCDVDFDAPAERWISSVLDKAEVLSPAEPAASQQPVLRAVATAPAPVEWSRERPFPAAVLANQRITGKRSTKDVRHVELLLEDSGLHYAPGDALGVVPMNPEPVVEQVLTLGRFDANAPVVVGSDTLPLADALRERLEITTTSRNFLKAWADASGSTALQTRLSETGGALRDFLSVNQVSDILAAHPGDVGEQTFVDSLRKLTPRLYSIASSEAENPDEVHLTVRRVNYTAHGREHWGSASEYLARRSTDDTVPVYVEPNDRFRLPTDGDTPVIMIGAGTGIAPYRAFLQQRQYNGDGGRNWLFFGDRSFQEDFLYQVEWLRYRRTGLLDRLDVAFSRDQAEKVYVQHRIAEQRDALYQWLDDGAHVYVCGDMTHMAPDVHAALRDVIATGRGINDEAAEAVLNDMKAAGRYQRDVY